MRLLAPISSYVLQSHLVKNGDCGSTTGGLCPKKASKWGGYLQPLSVLTHPSCVTAADQDQDTPHL